MTGRSCKYVFFVGRLSSSQLPVLCALAAIVVSLTEPLPARGAEVPFTEHYIDVDAWSPSSLFAADVDGDGDIDLVASHILIDQIAWYENGGGLPPTFTRHVISTTADEAISVFATDVDGDGDIDVLSASSVDDKIAW